MPSTRAARLTTATAALTLVACAPDAETREASGVAIDSAAAGGEVVPAVPAGAAAGTIRFTVAPTGNTARYRVRERLMGRDLDNDAVGETAEVTGAITVDSAGALVAEQSRFVVRTTGFKSDSDRRDGYVRNRLLQSAQFPTVELAPTALRGLPARLPAAGATAGPLSFELVGDLTVRGVTRPTTWRVTARQTGGTVTGTAATRFTFTDFQITPPKVPVVLSVADTIGLEYDFVLQREGAARP